MEKKNNSAGRLWRILGQIREMHSRTDMIIIWQTVLRINSSDKQKLPFEIARKINILRDELTEARREMQKKHLSEDLYSVGFKAADGVLRIESIHSNFASYGAYVTPEALKELKLVAEMIPDEEDEVTLEQLGELQAEIDKLRDKVKKGDFPDSVKQFIYEQIAIIENAIRDYNIVGAKAFKTAFDKAFPHIVENKDEVSTYAGTEEIAIWRNIWNRVIQYGGAAFKYGNRRNTAYEVLETVVKPARQLGS